MNEWIVFQLPSRAPVPENKLLFEETNLVRSCSVHIFLKVLAHEQE